MNKENKVAAESFAPGAFIAEELIARGWSQEDLAWVTGYPAQLISELVSGKAAITIEVADKLGMVFGTGSQLWMNLECDYQARKRS